MLPPWFKIGHTVTEPWLLNLWQQPWRWEKGQGGKRMKQLSRPKSVLISESHTLLYGKADK
jgi:hypothetical protein